MSDTKLTGFYFPWPNLGIKLSRQWVNIRQNTEKEAPLIRAAYVDAQPSSANDPGNHDLSGWAIGERDFRNRFRIWYDKTNDRFSIQFNSGTEAVEVWDDYLSIRQVDGRVTVHGPGGLDSSVGGFYSPVPRNMAVSSTFTPASTEWQFTHNLGTTPILWNAFNMEDKSVVPQTVDVSDPNTAYFYFSVAQAGRAIVTAEAARGEGITVDDGSNGNVFTGATRLGFNPNDFYLSNEGHGDPVVNLQPIDISALDTSDFILVDGSNAFTGDQSMGGNQLTNVGTPIAGTDAATKDYVDDTTEISITLTNVGSPLFENINKITFEQASFYLDTDSNGQPIIALRGDVGGGGGGSFGTGIVSDEFVSSAEWQFAHNLNVSANLIWAVYNSNGEAIIPNRVSIHDPNTAYFYFSPDTAGHAVIAGGPLVNTIRVSETDGTPSNHSSSKITFNSDSFYIELDSAGQPIVNFRGSSGGSGSGVTDRGALTGLSDDDHAQYLLASAATDRATFATNWTDLTDGGETSLHTHPGSSSGDGGFYGVNFRETDGSPNFRNDTIYFDSASFYLHPNSVGKPVLSYRGFQNVVEDTSPSLGGDLDVNAHAIIGAPGNNSNDGGHIDILAGDNTEGGVGGTVTINSGSSVSGTAGDITINAGAGAVQILGDAGITVADQLSMSNNKITTLATPTDATDAATKGYVDTTVGPGFYGVNFRETDGNPPGFRNDTIYFNSSDFYLAPNSVGEPILNLRGASGSSLTVQDEDGNPTATGVSTIRFTNGSVTDNGGGDVSVSVSAGGISTLTIGAQSFGSQTTLGFNSGEFYLSGGATSKVLNLREQPDIYKGHMPGVIIDNIFVEPDASHAFTVIDATVDCRAGTATVGFYIVREATLSLPGKAITGMDPVTVSTTKTRATATAFNTMNVGDRLVMSIIATNSTEHLVYTVRLRKT